MREFDPTASEFISSGYLERSRPGGQWYDPSTIISVGGSLIGGMMGSDAASDASNAQIAAGDRAAAIQQKQFDTVRADNAGYRTRGDAAGNKLAGLLGLNAAPANSPSRGDLRSQLLAQFTSQQPGLMSQPTGAVGAINGGGMGGQYLGEGQYAPMAAAPAPVSTVNETGLNAEIERLMAQQAQQQAAQQGVASADPSFGSLLKPFDASSVASDPGYQFAQNEGTQATSALANAGNGLFSGATLKALTRFGQGNATKYFGDAFNRDQVTKNQNFNMLSGVAGTGQAATNQVNTAGNTLANNTANIAMDQGNSRASGYVAQNNAWTNALGGGIKNYQQQNTLSGLGNSQRPDFFDGSGAWRA